MAALEANLGSNLGEEQVEGEREGEGVTENVLAPTAAPPTPPLSVGAKESVRNTCEGEEDLEPQPREGVGNVEGVGLWLFPAVLESAVERVEEGVHIDERLPPPAPPREEGELIA